MRETTSRKISRKRVEESESERCTRGKKNPHLPELCPDLVTALAGLYVDDFTVMTIRKKERIMQYQSSEMEQGNEDTQRKKK